MSFMVYGLIGLMPGDPIDLMISSDPRMTSEDAQRLREIYGLDQPLLSRWGAWLGSALSGDLGWSRLQARPVLEALAPALAETAVLMGLALVLTLAIALPAGILAARRPHSPVDRTIGLAAFVGISTPPFWLSLVLIIVFAVLLGVLPAGGTALSGGLVEHLRYLVLPLLALTLAGVGGYVRFVRAAMLETLGREWIRTARAKGVSENGVLLRHALRPAMIPVATLVGIDFGTLFSGALIVETVFARPGMGRLIYDAILGNDYNLALAALLLATALTLLGNLLADIGLVLLDRRLRLGVHRS
ncbi:MAG: ABC transporter permease [Rhodospirillales bacterium]|nr:ABC transporter permease [Rhodospirillales bacterium]